MKRLSLLFLICLSLVSVNAEEIKHINGVKNVYVDAENSQEAKFICDSLHQNNYLNSYVNNHISQNCKNDINNMFGQKCQDEIMKLYEQAICTQNGASSRTKLIKANQILQKHPSWNDAWIWQNKSGCHTKYISQLANKAKYCK